MCINTHIMFVCMCIYYIYINIYLNINIYIHLCGTTYSSSAYTALWSQCTRSCIYSHNVQKNHCIASYVNYVIYLEIITLFYLLYDYPIMVLANKLYYKEGCVLINLPKILQEEIICGQLRVWRGVVF